MQLSLRISKLKPSPTLALNEKAKALKAAGKSIVNLTAGEPDLPTPERVCKAAIEAIRRGETRYTATSGVQELKDAAIAHIEKRYRRKYDRSELMVTCGAKQAISNLCLALLNPGDEVIVFAPYWVSYSDMILMAGATPVLIETDESTDFVPNLNVFRAKISAKTRLVFFNSPCNPTGATYPPELLRSMAEEIRKHPDLLVMTDDIYEDFIYDGQSFFSIAMVDALPKEQLVIVNGVSKSYAMTGWRIGYTAGPKPLMSAFDVIQSNTTSNAASISQWAAVEALSGDSSEIGKMKEIFEERRNEIFLELVSIPNVTCFKPKGAFYFFPNIKACLQKKTSNGMKIRTDLDLSTYLLDEYGVAVVPGSAFGADGYLRLSFASPLEELKEGIDRMKAALSNLQD